MQLLSTIALGLGLVSTASGYVITLFNDADCGGESWGPNNVYDNSCSTPGWAFVSFRVEALGGAHQWADFYPENSCTVSNFGFWADGGDEVFQVGQCINLKFWSSAQGSRASAIGK